MGNLCDGKPQVLLHPVVENHFTLHNGQPGIIHDFRKSVQDRVEHTRFFYSPARKNARLLVDHRPDLSTYTQCPIPQCYCSNLTATQQGGVGGPPSNPGNPGTSSQGGNWGTSCPRTKSRTIHPIRTTWTSPPAIAGGGQGPHPGQSTQSGQQGLPPQHFQEEDKVPIPDNPPNQDNRDSPPSISRRGTRSPSRTIHPIRTTGTSPPSISRRGTRGTSPPPQHGEQEENLHIEYQKGQRVELVVNKSQFFTDIQKERSTLDLSSQKKPQKKDR